MTEDGREDYLCLRAITSSPAPCNRASQASMPECQCQSSSYHFNLTSPPRRIHTLYCTVTSDNHIYLTHSERDSSRGIRTFATTQLSGSAARPLQPSAPSSPLARMFCPDATCQGRQLHASTELYYSFLLFSASKLPSAFA